MGKMAWLPTASSNGTKILHLQPDTLKPFRPYTTFPHLAVPDHNVPGGSKGWATYQKLLKCGWDILPSDHVSNVGGLLGVVSEV